MKRFDNKKISLSLISLMIIVFSLITLSGYERDKPENPRNLQNYITDTINEDRLLAALTRVEACDELLPHLKEAAIQDIEERIDSYISEIIAFDGCCYPYKGYYEDYAGGVPPNVTISSNSAPQEGASEYSTTNVQVAGVDEADFIKNDGSYIYILANDKFRIIDAWPAEDANIISTVETEGLPKKLFITNDRALIYSSLDYIDSRDTNPGYYNYYGDKDECTLNVKEEDHD